VLAPLRYAGERAHHLVAADVRDRRQQALDERSRRQRRSGRAGVVARSLPANEFAVDVKDQQTWVKRPRFSLTAKVCAARDLRML
jgi:hypothetical protein